MRALDALSGVPRAPAILVLALSACGGGPHQVSESGAGAYEASVTAWTDGLAVAWYDTRDGNAEIFVRLLDPQGKSQGPEHRLTRGPEASYEADIVAVGNDFAAAWYEKSASDEFRPKLGLWTRAGEVRWETYVSDKGRIPVVSFFADGLFCAWIEDVDEVRAEVWAGWWELDGRPRSAPRRIGAAGATTWNLNAAIDDDGRAHVVFDAKVNTRSEELFLVRLEDDYAQLDRLTSDDGFASKYPDLAFGRDRVALTWFDERDGNSEVYLLVTNSRELPDESAARRVTATPGDSIGAYVAWNSGRFGLAWSDNTVGQHEVYFQSFDSTATPMGEQQRLTQSATDSLIPSIRPWGSGFALAWNELEPDPRGVHGPETRSEIEFAFVD